MVKLFDVSEFITAYNDKTSVNRNRKYEFLNTPKFTLMQKSLDGIMTKINYTAENIANVDTPGYKSKRVDFESVLREKLDDFTTSHAQRRRNNSTTGYAIRMINNAQPVISLDPSAEKRIDGNNVDIDHENLELARAKLQYDYMVRKISDEYNLLKIAVTEGKG